MFTCKLPRMFLFWKLNSRTITRTLFNCTSLYEMLWVYGNKYFDLNTQLCYLSITAFTNIFYI